MPNMLDYIDWRGDLTFDKSSFNDIDNLIFTQLSFIDFDSIVTGFNEEGFIPISEAAEIFFKRHEANKVEMGVLVPNDIIILLEKMASAPRFKDLLLTKYISKINYEKPQQFAAITIMLDSEKYYIAFRGTDDTIVGWKEDFNMGFMTAVPSQLDSVTYVEGVAAEIDGKIIIGGHSKGGNLSIYSALNCNDVVKERLIRVYNNDGPGFSRKIIDTDEYAKIAGKVKTIIPESSVVGIMLEHEEKFTIVKSSQSGLLQHDSFSWEVLGTDFIVTEERSQYSEISDSALKTWLGELNTEERELFVDTLFDILQSTDAKTLMDLNSNKLETAMAMLKSIKNLDDEKRTAMNKILGELFKDNVKAAMNTVFKQKEKQKKKTKNKRLKKK
ncbi:hypothetical protein IMSAG049_00681 [Clostridiales bacterium]|nr:hypothetical protein IMSAG049_00681 [Clostridiales bacterium]